MSILRIAVAACLLAASTKAAPIVFTFDADTAGTATGFTDTVAGLAASFSGPVDPGSFQIAKALAFLTLSGNVLESPGPSSPNGQIPLTIQFSSPLSGLSLTIGTNVPATFTLQAYDGSVLVGTITVNDTILPKGFFAEGTAAFSGATFNKVVLSATSSLLAIDNLSATPVPEPSALIVTFALPIFLISRRVCDLSSHRRLL